MSLASAASVFANLDRARYEPVPIRIEKDGRWALADKPPATMVAGDVIEQARIEAARPVREGREVHFVARPSEETILSIDRSSSKGDDVPTAIVTGLGLDVIFPMLHGPYGEDGTIQGLLELANKPYVGAGVLASAVGMDKATMKAVFQAHGLPIVEHLVVTRHEWRQAPERVAARVAETVGFPCFVKPVNLGSSVGISKVAKPSALAAAIDLAARHDRKIIIERGVNAREIEVSVLGNEDPIASLPGEITFDAEWYDYSTKYLEGQSRLTIPAPVSPETTRRLQELAIGAFRAIDCSGMARVDFFVERKTDRVLVNEINTIPGFTATSAYAKMWAASGLAYTDLVDRLIELALERHQSKGTAG